MSPHPVSRLYVDRSSRTAQVLDAVELVVIEGGFIPTPVTWDPESSPWLPIPFLPSALT
jgi:hypothetical protein